MWHRVPFYELVSRYIHIQNADIISNKYFTLFLFCESCALSLVSVLSIRSYKVLYINFIRIIHFCIFDISFKVFESFKIIRWQSITNSNWFLRIYYIITTRLYNLLRVATGGGTCRTPLVPRGLLFARFRHYISR